MTTPAQTPQPDQSLAPVVLTACQMNTARLALQFSKDLRGVLDVEELQEVVATNAERDDCGLSCASHDFVDANMVMAGAFQHCFGLELDLDEQIHLDVVNRAWSMAKTHGFDLVRIQSLLDEHVINEAVQDGLNAACLKIQQHLGVDDGGFASVFFSGENEDAFARLMRAYLVSQRAHMGDE